MRSSWETVERNSLFERSSSCSWATSSRSGAEELGVLQRPAEFLSGDGDQPDLVLLPAVDLAVDDDEAPDELAGRR